MFGVVNLCTSWEHSYEYTHCLKYREERHMKYERCHEQDNENDCQIRIENFIYAQATALIAH